MGPTAHLLEEIVKVMTRTLKSTLAINHHSKPRLALGTQGDVTMASHEDGFAVDRSFWTSFWTIAKKGYENTSHGRAIIRAHQSSAHRQVTAPLLVQLHYIQFTVIMFTMYQHS